MLFRTLQSCQLEAEATPSRRRGLDHSILPLEVSFLVHFQRNTFLVVSADLLYFLMRLFVPPRFRDVLPRRGARVVHQFVLYFEFTRQTLQIIGCYLFYHHYIRHHDYVGDNLYWQHSFFLILCECAAE